jgi:hypothetical protein
LSADDNQRPSAWQREHLLLTSCARERPWEIEGAVIALLTPPLNSAGNAAHAFTRPCVLHGPSSGDEHVSPHPVRSSHRLMVSEADVEKLVAAARILPPNTSAYLEDDFVMNLLETVLDYMLQTEVVVKALERFRENRWNDVRTLDDLERLMARFSADQAGNTALAQHLATTSGPAPSSSASSPATSAASESSTKSGSSSGR